MGRSGRGARKAGGEVCEKEGVNNQARGRENKAGHGEYLLSALVLILPPSYRQGHSPLLATGADLSSSPLLTTMGHTGHHFWNLQFGLELMLSLHQNPGGVRAGARACWRLRAGSAAFFILGIVCSGAPPLGGYTANYPLLSLLKL